MHVVRETSAVAWHQVENALGPAQASAYRCLVDRARAYGGSMSAGEIGDALGRRGVWKRMSELVRSGVVCEDVTRACAITGRVTITYAVVPDAQPMRLVRVTKTAAVARPTAAQLLATIEVLREHARWLLLDGKKIPDDLIIAATWLKHVAASEDSA